MTCEFCGNALNHNSEWTVCTPCDQAMMEQYREEDGKKARAWAAKHKCRDCGVGLPLTRRFKCTECDVPHLRETEDAMWEGIETGDIDDSTPSRKAKKKDFVVDTLVAREKKCNDCKQVKPVAEFSRDSYTKDMYRNKCKRCDSIRYAIKKLKQGANNDLQQV